ncbi:hypothetical protein PIOMA14_II_0621 [Prevotella intermedia]|uniref:Uncharacterized protein n=1 Tax=Prevotella intermedia TaxID=28131 RepID=A0A0T7APT5_PREIN|nr:hypothetical protein PIOMA14_II_0621 [Prevotella intermedia]
MRNNRFCNVLISRWLCNSCTCEKYLHFYCLLSIYRKESGGEVGW